MENEVRRHFDEIINVDLVVIGFDNAPDINALKMKYGKDYVHHLDERIPHFHGKGKKNTELTNEISFKEFLEEIKLLKSDEKWDI